ncbi:TPA: VWA domain-containing protein [Vibrio vulnificus]|nr:VWA domain-containing protein [Vibrio vulnificus]
MSLKRYPRHFRLRGSSMSIKKQQGVAGIIFMGMLPILVIIMVFSMQMTQRHMAHAKITEAAEVASLALIASPKEGDEKNQEYAQKIVDHYIPDNKGEVVTQVFHRRCEYKDGCVQRSGELAPFTDFVVSAKTKHDSWISYNEGELGLTKEFEVAGASTSRKYLPQPVDVYFIVDMSGSMRNIWQGSKTRFNVVVDVITRVVNDIKEFKTHEKSRVGLVGYHSHGVKFLGGRRKVLDYASSRYSSAIVRNMFNPPREYFPPRDEYYWDYFTYQDINLTEDYDGFLRQLQGYNFKNSDYRGTSSWQGIIGAAQMADKATNHNPEQVFIVLSDGDDNKKGFLQTLVRNGLCTQLKERIGAKKNRFQSDAPTKKERTKVTMGVIGIDFVVTPTDGFGDCFGHDNIYHAKEGNDVYKYILNLINEETGRLKD